MFGDAAFVNPPNVRNFRPFAAHTTGAPKIVLATTQSNSRANCVNDGWLCVTSGSTTSGMPASKNFRLSGPPPATLPPQKSPALCTISRCATKSAERRSSSDRARRKADRPCPRQSSVRRAPTCGSASANRCGASRACCPGNKDRAWCNPPIAGGENRDFLLRRSCDRGRRGADRGVAAMPHRDEGCVNAAQPGRADFEGEIEIRMRDRNVDHVPFAHGKKSSRRMARQGAG